MRIRALGKGRPRKKQASFKRVHSGLAFIRRHGLDTSASVLRKKSGRVSSATPVQG